MALDLAAVKTKASSLAANFTTVQKIAMAGAVVGVVVVIFVLTQMTSAAKPQAALYTGLAPADAAAVTEKLTSQGVPYSLANGGGTIMVPRDKLYDIRIQMAAQGLPSSGGEGYALLDKQGLTTSEFAQQVGYQRALEGELEKTISAMDNVQTASVHLAIPKSDVFAGDQQKPSAAVMLSAPPGQQIDPTQVQAVVHLVASSVQGMDAESVTVTDSTGALLAAPGMAGGGAGLDMNARQRTAYEQSVARSITALVEPIVGAGHARVTVNADLDFDKSTQTSETYTQPSGNPAQGTPQTQNTKTETYTGPGSGDAGVLGATGTPAASGGGTNYTLVQNDTANALNKVVETTEAAPGSVRRLGVAMAVDSAAASPETVQQIRDLVAAGAGINTQRGDTVQVTRTEFDQTAAQQRQKEIDAANSDKSREQLFSLLRQGAILLVVALVVFLIWRNLRRAAAQRAALLPARGDVRELEAHVIEPSFAPADSGELEQRLDELPMTRPIAISEDDRRRQHMTAEVAEMIDGQPTEVAQLLRGWLGDRRAVKR
jgi:flagellar M-ring protein FliF